MALGGSSFESQQISIRQLNNLLTFACQVLNFKTDSLFRLSGDDGMIQALKTKALPFLDGLPITDTDVVDFLQSEKNIAQDLTPQKLALIGFFSHYNHPDYEKVDKNHVLAKLIGHSFMVAHNFNYDLRAVTVRQYLQRELKNYVFPSLCFDSIEEGKLKVGIKVPHHKFSRELISTFEKIIAFLVQSHQLELAQALHNFLHIGSMAQLSQNAESKNTSESIGNLLSPTFILGLGLTSDIINSDMIEVQKEAHLLKLEYALVGVVLSLVLPSTLFSKDFSSCQAHYAGVNCDDIMQMYESLNQKIRALDDRHAAKKKSSLSDLMSGLSLSKKKSKDRKREDSASSSSTSTTPRELLDSQQKVDTSIPPEESTLTASKAVDFDREPPIRRHSDVFPSELGIPPLPIHNLDSQGRTSPELLFSRSNSLRQATPRSTSAKDVILVSDDSSDNKVGVSRDKPT